MRTLKHAARALFLVVGAVVLAPVARADRLPVYKLAGPKIDKARTADLFNRALGGGGTVQENERTLSHRNGKKILDVEKKSGHIFLGDMERLWNPKEKPNLPDQTRSKEIADKFLKDNRLLPEGDPNVKVSFSHYSESAGAQEGRSSKQILDRQVNYKMEVTVRGPKGDQTYPVTGGGAKLKVALGDGGRVIGFHGGWRNTAGVQSEEEILPKTNAEGEFRKKFGSREVENVSSRLAYYSAPGFEEQQVLAPVWVVSGQVVVGQQKIPVRDTIIAATKYGPTPPAVAPQKLRGPKQPPPPKEQDQKPQGSLSLPSIFGQLVAPPAYASPANTCGTEWIGPSQGLSGSPANAGGFVNGCTAAGWTVSFNWGEANAWESDWNAYDNSWIDAVDLVFYTGHANSNGWVLNLPNATFFDYTKVGGGSRFGDYNNEWIIIAACGPLQSSHFTTNVNNAFDRWRNIFVGMHVFMGYGAVTNDNTSEGSRFMQLCSYGWNVIDAWFRTAWEIQPSTNGYGPPNGPTVYVAAMFAHLGDYCERYDHLWGMGSTCSDPVGSSQQRYLMWAGC